MRVTFADATLASLHPRMLVQTCLTVEDGRIRSVTSGVPQSAGTVIPCSGKLLMSGNVCAHTHLYSALARGMPAPPRNPTNFVEILELIWWRLDRALDEEGVRLSTLSGLLDAVRAGTTTLVDHHASPNFIASSLDVQAAAFEEVGARGVLCYEVTDRNGPTGRDEGLRENDRFLSQNARSLVRGLVGAHASFTLGEEALDGLAAIAAKHDTGVHIHVAEDLADETHCMTNHRSRVVERLDRHDVIRDRSILAHCVHVDEREIAVMRERGNWIAHNCRSNMNNGVGRAPVSEFGSRVALGTDGIDGDMFAESHAAYWRSREHSLEAYADETAGRLGGGNQLIEPLFGCPFGLTPGAAADLLLLDYDPPTPLTDANVAWHWMFGMSAAQVSDVMVDGEWVMRNREFVTVDEEKIRADARVQAAKIWSRMENL